MSGDETRLHAMAQALARIARAAALRLPREVVDDAAQDAWVRWLDACGGEDEDGPATEPLAFLVGCFHHACADAVRAHRRRQRLQLFAAAAAPGAHASGGGGIEQLLDQVVRPALAGMPQADVELWIAAKVDGVGWRAAGAAAGMNKAAIERTRRRIARFLSAEDVLRRLLHRLDDVP
jgi:DNA-directed RNA polymerase specialized sigma24 family protein